MIFKVATLVWLLAITYFSLVPGGSVESHAVFSGSHVIAYAILSTLLYMSKIGKKESFGASFFYGLLMEIAQLAVPGRFFDAQDIAANALGASIVFLFSHLLGILKNKSHN